MACRVFRENTTLRWEEHGQQLEGAYSFFFSAVVRLYLERSVRFWVPQSKTDRERLKQFQWRAVRMSGALEHFSCEERLRELNVFRRHSQEEITEK